VTYEHPNGRVWLKNKDTHGKEFNLLSHFLLALMGLQNTIDFFHSKAPMEVIFYKFFAKPSYYRQKS
jgi:hypothetical protein